MIGKIIFLVVGLVLSLLILPIIIRYLLGVDILSAGLSFFVAVIFTAVVLGISAFLPYKWGKYIREVSYIGLFISLLIFFLGAIKPFYKESEEFQVGDCKNLFLPKDEDQTVYNALAYTSCILTGKFPKEQQSVGWTAFFLFYLVLPFAFIFALIYGLMQGMNLSSLFGEQKTGKYIARVLSFIITAYAARTMMGAFILKFMGYGAWGLAAVFGSIFLVWGLKRLVEGWFSIESIGEETRKEIENQLKWEAQFANAIMPILERAERLGESEKTLGAAKNLLSSIKDGREFSTLSEKTRQMIIWYIDRANSATTTRGFLDKLRELKEVLQKL